MFFSSRIRFRLRIAIFFSAQRALLIVADLQKKQLISGYKKASLFQEINKHFSSYVFFFRRPHSIFLNKSNFFFLVALINF